MSTDTFLAPQPKRFNRRWFHLAAERVETSGDGHMWSCLHLRDVLTAEGVGPHALHLAIENRYMSTIATDENGLWLELAETYVHNSGAVRSDASWDSPAALDCREALRQSRVWLLLLAGEILHGKPLPTVATSCDKG